MLTHPLLWVKMSILLYVAIIQDIEERQEIPVNYGMPHFTTTWSLPCIWIASKVLVFIWVIEISFDNGLMYVCWELRYNWDSGICNNLTKWLLCMNTCYYRIHTLCWNTFVTFCFVFLTVFFVILFQIPQPLYIRIYACQYQTHSI